MEKEPLLLRNLEAPLFQKFIFQFHEAKFTQMSPFGRRLKKVHKARGGIVTPAKAVTLYCVGGMSGGHYLSEESQTRTTTTTRA